MLGRTRLEGRADHHDHARRGGERSFNERQVPVVKGLEAPDDDSGRGVVVSVH